MTEMPFESQGIEPVVNPITRPVYWSLLREVWENRSIYVAPFCVAAFMLFGFLISTITLPRRARVALSESVVRQRHVLETPFDMLAGLVIITAGIVGVFYCLDALYGERRDRSILFWKSLPVSDRTAVLSKLAIPLGVLPAISFVIIIASHVFMLVFSGMVLSGSNATASMLWQRLPFIQLPIAILYALIAMALWHAPVYSWLLLLSAWSKRPPLLWAVLPPLVISMFEKMIFNTLYFGTFLKNRLVGWYPRAFLVDMHPTPRLEPVAAMTPGKFLVSPGLWIGLVFAALFIAAAIRLRRNREPI